MGGFLGIGQPAGVARSKIGLQNIFNWALPQGKTAEATGQQTLGSAQGFWQRLMSGNRTVAQGAIAPEANQINAQTDAARRQQAAMGTARGGGTAGPAQTAKEDALAKIQNMLFGARTEGAKQVADIGKTQLANASNLLGLGEQAIAGEGGVSLQQEKLNQSGPFQQAIGDLMDATIAHFIP